MELKLKTIVDAVPALGAISQKQLKPKAAVHVARLLKALNAELKVYNEERLNIYKKYGDLKGSQYELRAAERGQAVEALQELDDTVIKIEVEKLKLSYFANVTLSGSELVGADAFIEDDLED